MTILFHSISPTLLHRTTRKPTQRLCIEHPPTVPPGWVSILKHFFPSFLCPSVLSTSESSANIVYSPGCTVSRKIIAAPGSDGFLDKHSGFHCLRYRIHSLLLVCHVVPKSYESGDEFSTGCTTTGEGGWRLPICKFFLTASYVSFPCLLVCFWNIGSYPLYRYM